jgi:homocitrate synthase NifV
MENYIVDTTLRDGEQAPGVIFSTDQKMIIARLLDKLGVDEVELGTPAMGELEQKIIRDIATAGFNYKTISWCRALKKDIDMAATCKTDAVSISFPVSDIQLGAIGKNREWVLSAMPELITYAKQFFKYVYIGLQDASRGELAFLKEFIEIAINNKVDRLRLADTVGILNPVSTVELLTELRIDFPFVDFEFHAHNDFGMATANAFMALKNGATGVSGTINGLGERAGNAAIEELIMANYLNDFKRTKYNTTVINELCTYVAESSKRPLHCSKPLCGSNAFTHETGVHVRSVLNNKNTYQPIDESVVGVPSNQIVIGKHSGKAALTYLFNNNGEYPSNKQLDILHGKIHESIALQGKVPSEKYILNLYTSLQYQSPGFKA